jgi:lipoprotein-anchoring transpeptidase ErfK/SrfK
MPSSSPVRVAGPLVRRHARFGGLVSGAIAIAVLSSGCSTPVSNAASGSPSSSAASASESPKSGDQQLVSDQGADGSSQIATARVAQVAIRSEPGQGKQIEMANPTAIGAPLTFLVLETRPGWLKVQLPKRPNGSTGWVAQDQVTLTTTKYRLVISMSKHRLDVVYAGKRVSRHDVGVGKVATPTPKGTYYLTELIQPPDPAGAYGPYAFGLSAYSNTLKTFAGGPGQLGLHGTDAPHGLGKDISHGCIRVANSVITKLANELPLGTPVDIRA